MKQNHAPKAWWRTRDGYVAVAMFLVAVAIMAAVAIFGSPFADTPRCVSPLMNGGCPFG